MALIATVFMLNTNAQDNGPVTLELTSGANTCVYGTSIDLGQHVVSYDAFNMTGSNFTPSTRYCADGEGLADWTLSVELTDNLTNQYAQSIPTGNVYMDSSVNYLMSGTCTTGLNTINTWIAIDSVQTVLEKDSAA